MVMDHKSLVLAIWKRIQGSPRWLAPSSGQRSQDELDGWLASYRRMLASGVPESHARRPDPAL